MITALLIFLGVPYLMIGVFLALLLGPELEVKLPTWISKNPVLFPLLLGVVSLVWFPIGITLLIYFTLTALYDFTWKN